MDETAKSETVDQDHIDGGTVAAWATFDNGESVNITFDMVLEHIKNLNDDVYESVGKLITGTSLGGGLYRVDIDYERIAGYTGWSTEEHAVPLLHYGPYVSLRTDVPYFILFDDESSEGSMAETPLWVCGTESLIGDWGASPVTLLDDEDQPTTSSTVYYRDDSPEEAVELTFGDAGLDPDNLYCFGFGGRAPVTYGDLLTALLLLWASMAAASSLKAAKQEPEAITIRANEVVTQLMRATTGRKRMKGVRLRNNDGRDVVRVEGIENRLVLRAGQRKTFTLINQEATRMSKAGEYHHDGETVCRVALSVSAVAELRGISTEWAKRSLRNDFKAIADQQLTIEKKGKNGGWVTIPVKGGAFGIRGDNALFTLSPDIMSFILNPTCPQVDLPPALYRTDDTNHPAAFQLGYKMCVHDNQNAGKPNADRLKVTTILKAATEIPTPEEVEADRHRHTKSERIMRPFEAAMDHLVSIGVLNYWGYCHENGEPLTDDELEAIETEHSLGKPTPWSLAKDALVTWDLAVRYPELEAARQKSRDRRRAEAAEAIALKKKEDERREKRIRGRMESMEAKRRLEAADGEEPGQS